MVTDANGSYSVPSLPVGAYEITAEGPGFRVELVRGVELVVGRSRKLDADAISGIAKTKSARSARALVSRSGSPVLKPVLAPALWGIGAG